MTRIASSVRRRLTTIVGLTIALVVGAFASGLATHALAEDYVDGDRLLPGIAVGGVDVGGMSAREAIEAVQLDVEQRLDAEITVTDDDEAWTVTPRDLDATADVEAAVAAAAEDSSSRSWPRVAVARWGGVEVSFDTDVPLSADPDTAASFVDGLADEVDTDATTASVTWTGDGAEVVADDSGRSVNRTAMADALLTAVGEERHEVLLVTQSDPASIRSPHVEPLLPAIEAAVDATLDRPLTLVAGDDEWEASVRELAAEPDLSDVVAKAYELAEQGRNVEQIGEALVRIPITADSGRVADFVDGLAEEVAIDPVNAGVDHSSGWVELTPSKRGRALVTEEAAEAITAALAEPRAEVDLPTETVEPSRRRSDYRDVLLVRQNERKLYHYRDGEIAKSWDVAVGTGDQPTPTGQFSIGTKRYLPTWVNPSPNGWGKDMPARVEPGPSNPLGVRALNWNRNGSDTLIRFHGTSNTGSIGEAASNGCVRLTNSDVIDLYNRIPSGTTVVSVKG